MNYLSLQTMIRTSLFSTPPESPSTHVVTNKDDREQQETQRATTEANQSSLAPLRSIPRSDSSTSLLSLPSCTSTASGTPYACADATPAACPLVFDEKTERGTHTPGAPKAAQKRRHSTQMIHDECWLDATENMQKVNKSRIKVTCNNCYLWREKCKKQEDKLKELEARLRKATLSNAELHNKMNAEIKTQILKQKKTSRQLDESEQRNQALTQQNAEQSAKLNAMQQRFAGLKDRNTELEQESKTLQQCLRQTKQQGTKLLSVISNLQQRIVHIEEQVENKKAESAADSNNPWIWVLRMT